MATKKTTTLTPGVNAPLVDYNPTGSSSSLTYAANGYGTDESAEESTTPQFVISGNGVNSSGITGGTGSQWSSGVLVANGQTSEEPVTAEGVVNTTESSATGDSTTTGGDTTGGTTTGLDLTYAGNGYDYVTTEDTSVADSGLTYSGNGYGDTESGTSGDTSGDSTGSGDTSGESSEEEGSTWTYQQYLDYIESIKQNAYDSAQAQKERSYADAYTSYAQNKATYGANAETLASMGLTGSGYSDYINSQAYAQQRSDIQSANVTYAQAMADADTTYATNMLNYYQTTQEKFEYLLECYSNGTFTADTIDSFCEQYGLSETQKNALTAAANTYEANKAESEKQSSAQTYAGLLADIKANPENYDEDVIRAYASAFNMTDEEIDSLLAYRENVLAQQETEDAETATQTHNEHYASIYSSITADTTDDDISVYASLYSDITEEDIANLKAYRDSLVESNSTSNSTTLLNTITLSYVDGVSVSEYTPERLAALLKTGDLTQADYDTAISDYFSGLYSEIESTYKAGGDVADLLDTLDSYYNGGSNDYGITADDYVATFTSVAEYYVNDIISSDDIDNVSTWISSLKNWYKKGAISSDTYNNLVSQLNKLQSLSAYVDFSSGIDVEDMEETNFGSYWDTGKANSNQSNYIQSVIAAAQNGEYKNGTLIDPNYGVHGEVSTLYMYYNGKFYETTYTSGNIRDLIIDGYTVITGG